MQKILGHHITKRIYWLLFAILFYNSGQAFTIWLLEPESFNGGTDWLWLTMFPLLVPAFFMVNQQLGCASGQCKTAMQKGANASEESSHSPMPG